MGHHYRERHNAGDYDPNAELTKADLQERLKAQGLPTTGNKDELLERLNENAAQATTTSTDVAGLTS